ncbi:molybdopterin-dependent oxidoreductase [Oscillibacter hominis]|uniref:Molybdopterin-dependent oxidoreductase n=1 Tax=Oscillibacter hominis TaxID=2763056 RepID=A0A7G9B6Y5_9FIRM|nr:molybdopterin cofactor-binding domain-containing protein [Oscillibacter hominis]QNL45316.1 molybdopterin-dependent oxidoreductase [Oscillibacter hominis]
MNTVGTSMPRLDAELLVTGRARYGADLDLPGALWCKVKHSERAHAKIRSIDLSAAQALSGVAAVCTAGDFDCNRHGVSVRDEPFLSDDRVRGYYDSVAAVAAESEEIAQKAAALIRVEYEDLPGVYDPFEAMEEGSCSIHGGSNIAAEVQIVNGDVDRAFPQCPHIFEQQMYTPVNEHAFIEPHAAIAYLDETAGDLVVRTSVQRPALIAEDLALAIGWPQSRVRVITGSVGGGFGGKNEITFEHILAVLAIKTRRPVKMAYTREEEFDCSTVRHPYWIKMRSGVLEDGRILAREVRIVSDCGPYVGLGKMTLEKGCIHGCGPYRIPNTRVCGKLVYTNNSFGSAMRGFGVPQLGFAYEVHTDYIARRMGISPLEFRRINAIRDGDKLPTGMTLNQVTVEQAIDRVIRLAREGGDWE